MSFFNPQNQGTTTPQTSSTSGAGATPAPAFGGGGGLFGASLANPSLGNASSGSTPFTAPTFSGFGSAKQGGTGGCECYESWSLIV